MVLKFRKKPVVVEAVQYIGTPESATEVIAFIQEGDGQYSYNCESDEDCALNKHTLLIRTLEGNMRVEKNAFVIKGVKGEFYSCKEDIFLETYVLA